MIRSAAKASISRTRSPSACCSTSSSSAILSSVIVRRAYAAPPGPRSRLTLRLWFRVLQPEPLPKIDGGRQRHHRPRCSRYAGGSARGLLHQPLGHCPGTRSGADPLAQTGQLAMPAAITLIARLQPTCLAFQGHHVIHERTRNPKPRSRSAVRMPVLHKRDNPLTKCHRMWLAHLNPPYLLYRQGITDHASWES